MFHGMQQRQARLKYKPRCISNGFSIDEMGEAEKDIIKATDMPWVINGNKTRQTDITLRASQTVGIIGL